VKIAITKSTLRIPPTYFAVAHAQHLKDSHDFRVFTLVAEIRDKSITVPITDFVPGQLLGFRRRELVMPAFMPAMTLAVRRHKPDVIHQHFGTWSRPAVDAARLSEVPLITTLHGSDVVSLANPADTMMAKWHHRNVLAAAAQSQRLLAVSNYLAGQATALGMDADKIEVHYQGVDTDYFAPGAREAAGLVVLEAQACGTPVLAYRSGGIPEMLDDGTTGLLAGEAEFSQLRDGLLELLSLGDASYHNMRRAARQFVVENRSLAVSARQLDAHYRMVGAHA
jgi:glycosyltransferase involved in cell wall biosynthesis